MRSVSAWCNDATQSPFIYKYSRPHIYEPSVSSGGSERPSFDDNVPSPLLARFFFFFFSVASRTETSDAAHCASCFLYALLAGNAITGGAAKSVCATSGWGIPALTGRPFWVSWMPDIARTQLNNAVALKKELGRFPRENQPRDFHHCWHFRRMDGTNHVLFVGSMLYEWPATLLVTFLIFWSSRQFLWKFQTLNKTRILSKWFAQISMTIRLLPFVSSQARNNFLC